MTRKRYDVLIVGAGPGGTTLAYDLARRGVRTLIIERERLPRYKT
ncbi:MAG: FAD-dependent oxidoreductase [Dehalococcoidia bacterium]|nr:FAD-dependent oxidoreductase [Dehalococcoidia bacterium]